MHAAPSPSPSRCFSRVAVAGRLDCDFYCHSLFQDLITQDKGLEEDKDLC